MVGFRANYALGHSLIMLQNGEEDFRNQIREPWPMRHLMPRKIRLTSRTTTTVMVKCETLPLKVCRASSDDL